MYASPFLRMAAAALLAACLLATAPSQAGHRMVTVNGMLLGPQELAIADRNAGVQLPDGHYWYDAPSGLWGVVGGPALGRVPGAQQEGWSWRNDTTGEGMIYNPDGGSWQDQIWVSPR